MSGFAPNVDTATKPYADLDLFVANEAYSTQQVSQVQTDALVCFASCGMHDGIIRLH